MRLRSLLRPALLPFRLARSWRWHRDQQRLVRRGFYDPTALSLEPAVFIGGSPRSGSTLLREILARHPHLVCGVETALLVPPFESSRVAERCLIPLAEVDRMVAASRTVVDFACAFYGELARRHGKRRWVDKAPPNVRVLGRLLAWFPNGRFIHTVRDGRDVVCSLRHHPREILHRGTVRPISVNRPLAECATTWVEETSRGLALRDHPRCLELRYERLVEAPEHEVRRVCAFLGEEYAGSLLDASDPAAADDEPARLLNNRNAVGAVSVTSVGRWRTELDPAERSEVAHLAGALLVALGYADGDGWARGRRTATR